MIYTDGIHIITDQQDLTELHAFAKTLTINHNWFENKPGKGHPHYDFPKSWRGDYARKLALEHGAVVCDSEEIVKVLAARARRLSPHRAKETHEG